MQTSDPGSCREFTLLRKKPDLDFLPHKVAKNRIKPAE